MDERGAVQTLYCQRCGADYAPQAEAFITCRDCGMSINTRTATNPPRTRARREATAPAPVTGTELAVAGYFKVGALGLRAPPYPLAGIGSIALTDRYLVVTGYRPRGGWARALVMLLAVVVAVGLGWLLDSMYLPDRLVIGLPMLVLIALAMMPLPPTSVEERFTIPLEHVEAAQLGERGAVAMIRVRGSFPDGEIRFRTSNPAALCSRILAARASKNP